MNRAEKDSRRRKPRTTVTPEPGWAAALENGGFWLAAIVLAGLLVVFFSPVFFGGKGFQPPDVVASLAHRPYLQEAWDSAGSLLERYPLWTPYIFSGMPSFGSLIAAPYTNPMSLLLTPIPGIFKVVTYYFLLGLFTWLFLRRRGATTLASVFGAVSYMFVAHVITLIMHGHNSKIATLMYLPLALLATDELWRRPRLLWTAILALVVGTMLVSSHLQVGYYTLLAAGLYMLVGTVEAVRHRLGVARILARWGSWVVGVGLGLAASAVLFIPVREYAPFSIRGGPGTGLTYDYATSWSFHPVELATWLVPNFVGFGSTTYWGWMPFTDFPHYMGILVLFLAVLTLVLWPRDRLHVYLAILAVGTLLLAFGKHLPLFYNLMFEAFPMFNKFRVPSMILLLTQFAVAMLAALGLSRLVGLTDPGERAAALRKATILVGAMAALVVVLGGLVAAGGVDDTMEARFRERGGTYGLEGPQLGMFAERQSEQVRAAAGQDIAVGLVILGAGFALLWLRLRGRLAGTVLVLGVLALTVLDLWRVGQEPADYKPRRAQPASLTANGATRFMQQQAEGAEGTFRILPLTSVGRNNSSYAYFRLPSILGYHAAKLKIYQDVIDEAGGVGITGPMSRGNFNVINMLNTRFVVADQELPIGPLRTVYRGEQFVMENSAALPRAWFVDRTRVVADEQAHKLALADPLWDPATEALVFEDPGPVDSGTGGRAAVTFFEPREIHLDVTSPGDCFLVLSEVWYPAGWHAWIDGEPAEIHRVNYLLRGVRVPPGEHELRLRFDPASFRTGAALSVGAYGVIALGILLGLWRERRRPATAPVPEPAGD